MNYWLLLQSISGIGPATFNKLLKEFGTPQEIFHVKRKELLKIISEKPTDLIFESKKDLEKTEHILFTLKQRGFRVITIQDSEYPPYLACIQNPPPMLYVYEDLPFHRNGNTSSLTIAKDKPRRYNIAIIGARLASKSKLKQAFEFASELADLGFTIVSGYAKGIDTQAHLGAIKCKGHTIMILPTGVFNFRVHKEFWSVSDKLFAQGTILSEFYPFAKWTTAQAILRNRLTSGLSDAVLVVDSGTKGGTISTARWASCQGKALFICESNLRNISQRTQEILALGAIPVKNSEDLLEKLDDVLKK